MNKSILNFMITATILFIAYKIPDMEEIKANILELEEINLVSQEIVYAQRDTMTTQDKVFEYLKSKGLGTVQIAGIMGNIEQESSFIPDCIESNGIGFGLIQWSFQRRTDLFNYANDPYDMYQQLDFLLYELDRQWTGNYKQIFYNSNDVEEVANAFCWGFERPSKRYANIDYRIKMAQHYYELYK